MSYIRGVVSLVSISVVTFGTKIWAEVTDVPTTMVQELPEAGEDVVKSNAQEGKMEESAHAPLPLVKTAHKDATELLRDCLEPKSIYVPNYVPFLQALGIKIYWADCLYRLLTKGCHYAGGIDLLFRGNIQLSLEGGYQYYEDNYALQGNVHPGAIEHSSKGNYGVVAIRYMFYLDRFTNAYGGVAYGCGRFNLIPMHSGVPLENRTASWLKLVLGSETQLLANSGIYGGMQLDLMHLLSDNVEGVSSNYIIPGYGKVRNRKVNWGIILYLKWNISFLEKKMNV